MEDCVSRLMRVSASAAVLLSSAAGAQELGDPKQGLAYARSVCAECHAVEPGEILSPAAGAPSFTAIANTLGMTPLALDVWLQSGHPTMPSIMLSRNEKENVIAYITGLREKP